MSTAASGGHRLRHHRDLVLLNLAIAGAYYAAARLGLLQQLVNGQVTPLWPPTGIALASLLFWGPRVCPAIAVAAFAVNIGPDPSPLVAAGISVGNTAAPLAAYLVLRRVGFRTRLDRLRDALALVFLGALGGMLISATVGTGVLVLSDALAARDFWSAWSVWWTGDAMGVLIVAPCVLVLHGARWPPLPSALRWLEAGAMLLGVAAVTVFSTRSDLHVLFLVGPFLIWAAFRFRLAGAAPCALVVSVLAIDAAADDTGPFEGHQLAAQMFTLQAFNGTTALTALLLSALITERNNTQRQIARVCRELTDTVAALSPREPG
ncbi:MASE1 domain-containing protein [Streptomyces millisiae]|uniref:MASE1 domain-containing protein n=1 Tax=Streptomyces millisiae TaxID=3075542 RepID=A0ABU2LM56_9ACTN|nr:MASE1 domain-containing protein [Streptomyces sp. DSM 44918]MDT0318662.1 MASE1 domain-containing protein [Streptomyces sp. DSM 44918]